MLSPLEDYTSKACHNLGGPWPMCINLTDSFILTLSENLNDTNLDSSSRLFHLAYSSWRNGLLLAQIGAASQVPICLRHVLESLAYCFLCARDKDFETIWWDRETSDQAKRKLRERPTPLERARDLLDQENPRLWQRLKSSLDHFIDFGAHPNVFQLVNATHYGVEDEAQITYTAMLGDNDNRQYAFVSCLNVGLMMSEFFELIWPLRFDLLGGRFLRMEVIGQGNLFSRSVLAHQSEKS